MWFRQRKIVANLRRQEQGHLVSDNFLHRLWEVVKVSHHCLVTVSVAMHTGQLGIQGLPLLTIASSSRGTWPMSPI